MSKKKVLARLKIKRRVRGKLSGTSDRPRLSVFRSNKQIYAQIIDDSNGRTLASASSLTKDGKNSQPKLEQASTVSGRSSLHVVWGSHLNRSFRF
jgi:large subunit ribosomal protein L18